MIQALALLAAGFATVGIWLTDSFALLVACWVLGTVLQGGLVLAVASPAVRGVTREVVLAEMFGSWVLLMAGLNLVLATGVVDLASPELEAATSRDLGWSGLGLLLAVGARLGLPPIGPWPTRLAASPPAVRVFLHAMVYPLSAHLLWWRLDMWLLPWHRVTMIGLCTLAALAAVLAATGERQPTRRAALLSSGLWTGLLALSVQRAEISWLALGLAAAGAMTLHILVILSRRRPETGDIPRRPLWPFMTWLARQSRRPGPLPWALELATGWLSSLIASIDKVVLDGVAEGLALLGMGAGWLVAWCDRRGLDALERGAMEVTMVAGRWTRTVVATGAARLVILLGATVMALIMLGGEVW